MKCASNPIPGSLVSSLFTPSLYFRIHWIFHLLVSPSCAMHSVAIAMVVETCAYEVSWPFALLSGYCVGNCLSLFNIYCCHGDGSDGRHVCTKYHGHTHYYQATMLQIVINCLRLFLFCCYHGNGSDGRHVCTKYHGHTHYYQATMLQIVINCLRLLLLSFIVTMAMVVMCVQSITAIHTTISNL